MKPVLTFAFGAFALASCTLTTPDGVETSDVDLFEAAVASLDCNIRTERDYNAVQFQAGLTREQALSLAGYELGSGRAERLDDGTVRLIAGPCAPGATPVQTLVIPDAVT